MTALLAEILRLDQILRRYGSDTDPARKTLRQYAEHKAADLFPDDRDVQLGNPSTYELLQRVEDMVLALKPANPRDQWWLGQAMTLAGKIGDARWLLAQRAAATGTGCAEQLREISERRRPFLRLIVNGRTGRHRVSLTVQPARPTTHPTIPRPLPWPLRRRA